MSRITNRKTAPHQDTPLLARIVPHLTAETLHQLIQYHGLDACGELVTSATPAQLTSLLDLDLWRQARPDRDEQFDVDRFGEWLEVLVDAGEVVAARTVAALDKHLVIAGLSRYLRVFDPGTFEPTESTANEPINRHDIMNGETTGDGVEYEVGGYLVRPQRTDAWDAIVTLLVTLETEHNDDFHAVMQGCRRLSNSPPEIDGLDDLLLAPEQHLHDTAMQRERRRSRQGYAIPADARTFLQMARQPAASRAPTARAAFDSIARAYFRAAEEEADAMPEGAPADALESARDRNATVSARAVVDVSASIEAVIDLLTEAGLTPERPRALLGAADGDRRATKLPLLRRLLKFALRQDENAYVMRTRELAFLANTLLAGCSVQSRTFTPQEASDAAACVCNLGLECWPVRWPGPLSHSARAPRERDTAIPPDAFLVGHDLVMAFEVGWSVLFQDVSLFVADQLISTLSDLRCVDADTRHGLRALRLELVKQRQAGRPWLARGAADVLSTLDATAWVSVVGLLDECPILPEAVTAVLEHRTTSVSPIAFEFMSRTGQIGDIRVFMRALPGMLAN